MTPDQGPGLLQPVRVAGRGGHHRYRRPRRPRRPVSVVPFRPVNDGTLTGSSTWPAIGRPTSTATRS